MGMLCIQIQPHRAPDINLSKVKELSEGVASDGKLVSSFGIVEGEDGVPYINLMFKSPDLPSLWRELESALYGAEDVRGALLRSSMAMCEGRDGWSDYCLLYHFDLAGEVAPLGW